MGEGIKKPMVTNAISMAAYQGVNALLPLVAVPFLFRQLGDEFFGLYSFAWATVQILVMITDFGFNLSATKYISSHKGHTKVINRYLNGAFISRILLGILCLAALLVMVTYIKPFNENPTFFLLFFGVVVGNVMFPMWFFQGIEKMKYITIFNIVAKLVTFIPIFIVIRTPADFLMIPVFFSIGYILAGVISLYFIYKKEGMKWFFPAFKEVKAIMKDSSTYFLSRISVTAFTRVNVLVLGMASGSMIPVSFYSRAETLYKAYNLLISPITDVIFPHMANTKDVPFFKKLFYTVMKINVPVVILVLVFAGPLFHLLYADASIESVNVFRILMIGCLITIPSMMLGYPFLAALGHASYTNMTIVITSVVHICGVFLLYGLGFLSIYSMAAMVVFSESLLFFFRVRKVAKLKLFK